MTNRTSKDDKANRDESRAERARDASSERGFNDARKLTDSDLGADKMGNNQLQGDDQEDVQNQRRTWPDEKQEPEDVVESFEKTDKDVRARRDLGKKE